MILITVYFLAQWKLNEINNLINRNVPKTQYTDEAKKFTIPKEGEKGYIQKIGTNTVLGIGIDDVVSLEVKSSPESEDQMWIRGAGDNNGWFTFTNEKSGKVLTQEFGNITTIESKADSYQTSLKTDSQVGDSLDTFKHIKG